jgi:hypothetical protein
MTTPLAGGDPQTLHAATIGAAWLAVARRIIAEGIVSRYDDLPVREISLITLAIDGPDPGDEVIARYGEPGRLAWMHANFTSRSPVAALGGADSYATRLFDYEHSGRDQVAWVIDRLRRDPAYAHSIDFGAKGYGNLAELASLQHHVAGERARRSGLRQLCGAFNSAALVIHARIRECCQLREALDLIGIGSGAIGPGGVCCGGQLSRLARSGWL